jgi:hypothetical protein
LADLTGHFGDPATVVHPLGVSGTPRPRPRRRSGADARRSTYLAAVHRECSAVFGGEVVYLVTDLCRADLLVEIEA